MAISMLQGILLNVAFLLAVGLVYDLAASGHRVEGHPGKEAGVGAALGLICVGLMITALEFAPGVIVDARSVVLGISGLFFGVLPTLIAVFVSAAYRTYLGGGGAFTGVLVIVASGGFGLAWRRVRKVPLDRLTVRELLLFGVALHVGMVGILYSTLPGTAGPELVSAIAVPVLLLFPPATAALGALLVRRRSRESHAERLVESEARYRNLFENNLAVMLLLDPKDGRIVDANPAACRFYGHERSVLQQMRMSEITTLSPSAFRVQMDQARGSERDQFQMHHRLVDGSVRPVEVYSGPISVGGQELVHSIVHDVSARIQAQDRLRERDALLRLHHAALEAAANPILITDRKGTIEWVNQAFLDLYGYAREEVLSRNPRELIRSDVHDHAFFADMWQTILAGRVWKGQITNRKKDGGLVQEEQTVTPVRGDDGGITHFVAVKADLTERLAMEVRLSRTARLETVGRLAGGVAHDFNNLLTVINGTAQLALQELSPEARIRRELSLIHEAGVRAAKLTGQLLAFGKRQVIKPSVVDLNELVRDLLEMLGRLLGEDVRIESRLCSEPAWVRVDPSQLEQVVTNLALNARDAMPDGGRLEFQTEIVSERRSSEVGEIGVGVGERWSDHARGGHARGSLSSGRGAGAPRGPEAPPPTTVLLRVRDTGAGMPDDVRAHIFEPFFTTKPQGEGTGLGLATVYGIVTQSGGDVRVETEPGRGSTFEIHLPRAEPPTEPATPPEAGRDKGGSETVLLVEDEPAILEVARRILRRSGYRVLTAGSAEEALAHLDGTDSNVDLVLTDVVMPGMSGPELVRRIRTERPGIKVLFASGYTQETLVQHGVRDDHQDFIPKPYSLEGLRAAVREMLDRD